MHNFTNEQLAAHLNAVLALDASAPEPLRLVHGDFCRALLQAAANRLGDLKLVKLDPAVTQGLAEQRVGRVERDPLAHMGTLELLQHVLLRFKGRTAHEQEADIIGALAQQVRAPGTITSENCGDCPNDVIGGCKQRCIKAPPLGPDQTPRETSKWSEGYNAGYQQALQDAARSVENSAISASKLGDQDGSRAVSTAAKILRDDIARHKTANQKG